MYNLDKELDKEFDDNLDMSWIVETERLSKIDQNYARENMNEIKLHSIYINKINHIDKIVSTVQPLTVIDLSNITVGLTNDFVIKLVEKMKILNNIKYKLLDILVFNVDLEPENIQSFSQINTIIKSNTIDGISNFSLQFLKTYSVMQNIKIPASIFIFHDLNSIYMIFQEITNSYTSILKKPDGSNHNLHFRKTKKVSIDDSCLLPEFTHKKTKKYHL